MKIIGDGGERRLADHCRYQEIGRDGQESVGEQEVLTERCLTLYLEDEFLLDTVCTGQYLPELVLGRLYTEGIIQGIEEIKTIRFDAGGRVEVVRERRRPEDGDVTDRAAASDYWEPEWIFALADRLEKGMPLHQKTWAAHSCFLARKEVFLFACEDLGRHNAFDKVIGYALRHGILLEECIVYSSGRIPVDMVKKAIRAGVQILAAKAVPTMEAVRLAEISGITLIGASRSDRLRIYTPSLEGVASNRE